MGNYFIRRIIINSNFHIIIMQAADWHPTEKLHTKAAEALTEEIKSIMNW